MGTYEKGLQRLEKVFEDMAKNLGPDTYKEWLLEAKAKVRNFSEIYGVW